MLKECLQHFAASPFLSRLPLSTPLVSSTSTTANNSTGSTSAFASAIRKTALSSKVAGKKLTDQHESPNARTQNPATPMNQAHEVTSTSLKTGRTHTASPAGHVSVRGSGAAESACLRIGEASLNTPGSVDANISSYIQPIEPQRNSTGATHPMINTEPVRNATCSKPENSMPASIPGASLSVDRSHPEEEADDLLSKAVDAARRGKESLLQQYLPDLKDCCDHLVHLLVTATVYNQPVRSVSCDLLLTLSTLFCRRSWSYL